MSRLRPLQPVPRPNSRYCTKLRRLGAAAGLAPAFAAGSCTSGAPAASQPARCANPRRGNRPQSACRRTALLDLQVALGIGVADGTHALGEVRLGRDPGLDDGGAEQPVDALAFFAQDDVLVEDLAEHIRRVLAQLGAVAPVAHGGGGADADQPLLGLLGRGLPRQFLPRYLQPRRRPRRSSDRRGWPSRFLRPHGADSDPESATGSTPSYRNPCRWPRWWNARRAPRRNRGAGARCADGGTA